MGRDSPRNPGARAINCTRSETGIHTRLAGSSSALRVSGGNRFRHVRHFLTLGSIAPNELLQRNAHNAANRVQFQQVQTTNAVLVFAYDGLVYAKGGSQFVLGKTGLFTDSSQQRKEGMLLPSAAAQSWSTLRHENARVAALDRGCDYRIPLSFRMLLSALRHHRAK